MTYRKLIELYRIGKLNEEQKKQIEADIERQEAISEYLFEYEKIPLLEDLEKSADKIDVNWGVGKKDKKVFYKSETMQDTEKKEADAMEERFIKMIRGSIRKAFFKMGICVGAMLLLMILFIMFCLPEIVDGFYYQPDEIVAEGRYSRTNRMSLDMAVYSELFLPGKYRNNVVADSNGYGEYDINIVQNFSTTGTFYNVAGKVERGKLTLYDVNLLTRPTGNAFVPEEAGVGSKISGMGAAGSQEQAYERLKTLDENEYYMAYVTLSEVMSYKEFKAWFDSLDFMLRSAWCAAAEMTENKNGYFASEIIGFDYAIGGMGINFDKKKYPYLSLLDTDAEIFPEDSPEIMQTHFVSMLRYMAEQKEFCDMMENGNSYIDWEKMAQNVEENGLYVYGIAIETKRDTLLKLSEMEEVCYIYTTPLQ